MKPSNLNHPGGRMRHSMQSNGKDIHPPSRRPLGSALLAMLVALVFPGTGMLLPIPNAEAGQASSSLRYDFDIPPLPLDRALMQLAQQANVEIYMNTAGLSGLSGNAVAGTLALEEALRRLLAGRDIQYHISGGAERPVIRIIPPGDATEQEKLTLMPLAIEAGYTPALHRHEAGHNAVYDSNYSSVYADKRQIDRNKGSAPADVFKGMPNIYSGDPRNSGAIDPNIRGIQGPGRVPLTIDGTEQALTAYRGYNGANNRSYIDPNLLSSIQVIKGPAIERDIRSGVGGAVVMRTLEVDDILGEGQASGGELRMEQSNNSVQARLPKLLTGQNYQDIPGFLAPGESPTAPWNDPSLRITPRSSSHNKLLSSDDQAYRLALASRQERFELLGAYAYREKGNHFAGKRKSGFYSQPATDPDRPADSYATSMALYWKPGEEVLNTSSKMESWLLKGKLIISDDQDIRLGIRDTYSLYGEIMPPLLEYADNRGHVQWPLSRVDSQAYNLEYNLSPDGNPWLDLHANLWMTHTRSDTYTRGGFPNAATENDPILWNSALSNSENDRYGLTLSNRFTLHDNLDLILGGSFQHEKLDSGDRASRDSDSDLMPPRAGTREEYEINYNFKWRPVQPLTVEIGGRYSSYWAFDDYLQQQQKMGNLLSKSLFSGRQVSYTSRETRTLSEQEWQGKLDSAIESVRWFWDMLAFTEEQRQAAIEEIISALPRTESEVVQYKDIWYHDGSGRYSRANNPCVNGTLDGLELIGDEKQQTCTISGLAGETLKPAKVRKQKDRGWTPALSLAVDLSTDSRLYFRHSQALRYPSMFESTMGFSAYINPYIDRLKPEHAYDYEISYVHNLTHWLKAEKYADIKVSYYHHITKDLIERDTSLVLNNIEKQTIRGIEFQGRYDNGGFFTDIGAAYTIENEVCDEHSAILADPIGGSVPDCVDNGFPGGYLATQSLPRYSISWLLGRRFMNERLEVGGKVSYYYKQEYENFYTLSESIVDQGNAFSNRPLQWAGMTLYDAYLDYKLSERISIELTGTNLTNIYYIDPISRSMVAAPGRTLKLGLTINF
ncbi:TonB-dependent receptor [Stutzerimonas kirkiae]|uniref:TonB-dependent receptor n=2 Tax=Stutzerimonas kirkiae TaxID=2211392 RepID=A0A4Q9REK8_9GAMM|nr:TonB-dependent receptor [Stutzerimonas kirkiae]TBV06295.1 TonB-dependent receptor [Stutzerimonas kirkiae]